MVMATNTPQGVRINPQNTLELSQGMSIQTAINTADAHGGFWTILLYPGMFYDEGDITPGGTAIITIKGMGQNVTIRPTAAPATAVINMTETLYLENLTVIAPDATRPAVLVNTAIGVPVIRQCNIIGVAPGYSVQMTQGTLDILYSGVSTDVHLSTARCVLDCYQTSFFGDIITAAEALNHDIDLASCNMTNGNITSNATGATIIHASHTGDIGTVTNAGTGLFTFLECYLDSANCTNAAGEIRLRGGSLSTVTRAAGSVIWWLDGSTIKVLPSGTITDTMITYALAAAAAAGGKVTIRLATGDYEEDNMTLVDDVNIVGEGHTAASGSHITINSANPIFTAGAIQSSLRHLRITQAGAGDVFVINNAAAVVHTDDVVFGSTGGNAVTMTAGRYSCHGSTSNSGNYNLSTAACTLICHNGTIMGGNIVTAGALAHTVDLNAVDMSGGTITNGATGVGSTTTIGIWSCYNIASFTDASQLGTVTIEDTVITSAVKSGTSPWTCRISDFGLLSNTNVAGAITSYMGEIYAIVRAIGPIVWWQDSNTLKVIPSGTITDTVVGWAVAAALAGDTIVIYPGTYEEAVTLTAGRNLVGIDKEACIINIDHATLITMAEGCCVANLTLDVTGDATGDGTGIECNDVSCRIEDLIINLTRTGNNVFGISENTGDTGATIHIRNVRLLTAAAFSYGFYLNQENKTVYVENSHFECVYALYFNAGESAIYTSHNSWIGSTNSVYLGAAISILRMSHDTIKGIISNAGVMTYKNGPQQYEVWPGMQISDAIAGAAAPLDVAPSAANPYTVLIHPGIYDEQITMSSYVNLMGVGSKGSVVIYQNNANVVILADNVELQNLTLRIGTQDADRNCITDNFVACTAKMTEIVFESVTPGAGTSSWHALEIRGAGNYIVERCSYRETVGTGDSCGFFIYEAAATLRIIGGDFYMSGATGPPTSSKSHIAVIKGAGADCLIISEGNRYDGDEYCNTHYMEDGTCLHSQDAILTQLTEQITLAGVSVCIKNNRQEYEVYEGMWIQHAITAAAADTPTPSATNPYTVLIHPGIYTEVVTMADYVNIQGVGGRGAVIITTVNDADMFKLATATVSDVTIRLQTPDIARSVVRDNGVKTAIMERVVIEVTTPSTFNHRLVVLWAASTLTMDSCSYNVGGTGAIEGVRGSAAVTVHLFNNDFTLNNVNARHISSDNAGATWTGGGNRYAGTCAMFWVTNGTITLDNEAVVCTGMASGDVTGGTVTLRTGHNSYEVFPGMQIQHAVGAGRYIFLHPGTYILTATLDIDYSALAEDVSLTIQGCGRQTIITTATANLDIIYAHGASGHEMTNLILRDFVVRGFETGAGNDLGIYWSFVDSSKLIDVWVEDCYESGIKLEDCDHDEIIHCEGMSCTENGLLLLSCTYCQVDGGEYNDNTLDGVQIEGDATGNSDYNKLTNATCIGNGVNGVHIVGAGQANKNIILGNQLLPNTGATLVDGGTNTEVAHNISV